MKACSRSGFTLIELVIVLGIVAALGITTVTIARGLERRTLNYVTQTLQADIRHAQRMALIEGRRWQVVFNVDGNRYYIRSFPWRDPGNSRSVYLPQGVEFAYLGRHNAEFLPRGTLAGTQFAAGAGFSMEMRTRSFRRRITVLPVTGRVELYPIENRN